MTVMLFIVTFILFVIICMSTVFIDAKIQRHVFLNYPKLWKSFGYPDRFHWHIPAKYESEFIAANFQLNTFLKSPKCKELDDVVLQKLVENSKLISKVAIFMAFCMLIVGCIAFSFKENL